MSLAGIAGFAEGFANARQKKNDREQYDKWLQMQEAGLARLGAAPMGMAAPAHGAAASYPGANMPQGEQAEMIRAGLIKRGMPDHIADAFILNFKDESGLDPGINELKPLVPGSRGGYGLYQLTGPRRRAYEAFAQSRGVDYSDVDAQLDFLMTELQGPEASAAKAIYAAPNTGQAAAAIVNKFLRPAEQHRASRVARYLGYSPTEAQSPQPQVLGAARPPYRSNAQ